MAALAPALLALGHPSPFAPVLGRRLALDRPRAGIGASGYGFGVLPGFWVGGPPGGGESVGQSGKNGTPQISGGGSGIGQRSVGAKIPPQLLPYGKKPLP